MKNNTEIKDQVIEGFRLSPQQKHLWLLQDGDRNGAYCAQVSILLEGNLQPQILKRALQSTIQNHEILRTIFTCLPDVRVPLQVISEANSIEIEHQDLSHLSTQLQSDKLEIIFEDKKKQIHKNNDQIPQFLLIRLSIKKHILLIRLPALCADAISLNNLSQEIGLAYKNHLLDKINHSEVIQYADVSEWQNELLEAEDTALGREYWQKKDRLESLFPKLPFASTQNGGSRGFECRSFKLEIKHSYLSLITDYVYQNDSSIDLFLFACWSILLWRLTGKADILTGRAYSGRTYEELESAIGLFAKYLPVQIRLREDNTFKQLLNHISQVTKDIHKWQDSYNLDLHSLGSEVDMEVPICPLAFDFLSQPEDIILTDIKFSIDQQYICFDRHHIRLSCLQKKNALLAFFYYDSNIYLPEDIERFAEEYQQLISSVLEQNYLEKRNSTLRDLDILGPTECQKLLQEFQGPVANYTLEGCIHQRFEQQVQRTPNQVAVVYQEQQLTYAQLDQRANTLASYLQHLGVRPDTLVGLCVERSLAMIVGILGILKAGGAYVPLDPILPKDRLELILADAQPSVLLIQTQLRHRLPDPKMKVVLLDDVEAMLPLKEPRESLVHTVRSDNLAYVIYTSGSTGQPKGVLIPHQNVTRLFEATHPTFHFSDNDVWTMFHSYGFDFSVWEMWGALLHGGRLVIVPESITRSPECFYQLLRSEGITILNQTPSAFYQFSQSKKFVENFQCLSIRLFMFGGEAFPNELATLFMDTGAEVWNLYGPTEATVWTTIGPVEPDGAQPTIGTPIPNTKVYILDSTLKPVPIGVPGELYIGGDRLAIGYLNRGELTSARFIPNPFNNRLIDRLYKTGDLARYRTNGEIEFLGRSDTQIKLRGFRIELSEIEVALQRHPAVTQAVVSLREDVPNAKRLVAYLVSNQSSLPSASDLGNFLRQTLPTYMVPSAFVMLAAFPLTPNGKVDRTQLPVPSQTNHRLGATDTEPSSALERFLVKTWQTILGLDNIGIHDNFFELGGDSIQAAICIMRVQETIDEHISVIAIFETLTVHKFAQYLQVHHANAIAAMPDPKELNKDQAQSYGAMPILGTQSSSDPSENVPLSFFQKRMWVLENLSESGTGYNVYAALNLEGQLNKAALEESLTEILRRHDILRTIIPTLEGRPYQQIAKLEPIKLSVVSLTQLSAQKQCQEVHRRATESAQYHFNLVQGPLVTFKLLQLDTTEHVLLLTLSHLVADGWSLNLFIRELVQLYPAFAHGRSSPLPELTLQYADYSRWQNQQLQDQVLEDLLSYWRRQLKGATIGPNLPTDRPRPKTKTYTANRASLSLSQAQTQQLKDLSQQSGATLFMTLLAAFKVLLSGYSRQEDIIVGTPIACRNQAPLDKMIGFFANNLVLRTNLSGDPSFQTLLGRVRDVALGAYAHQNLPFSKLVEDLNPLRSTAFTPLFQVFFVLQHTTIETTELSPDLSLSPLDIDNGVAIYDLNIFWIEGADGQLTGTFQYDPSLFDANTIAELLSGYHSILDASVADPTQPLSTLLSYSQAQQAQTRTNPAEYTQAPFIAPHSRVEKILTSLWSNILELETIGVQDNFFALGGSSLLAAQISYEIHQTFQIGISLKHLFEYPTIEQLAGYVTEPTALTQNPALQPIRPVQQQGPYLLSFAQQRVWFLDQLEPGNPTYNITRTLRLQGTLDLNSLERALNVIITRHGSLRTTFTAVEGKACQAIAETRTIHLSVIDLRHWAAAQQLEEANRLRRAEFQCPFNLSSDLMVRATVIRLSANVHWLLLVTHHIASDGWSMEILIQELSRFYEAFCASKASPFAPLPIQYVDFAQWQHQWLQGKILDTQLTYWKQQLAGAPPFLELPTDRLRPAMQSYRAGNESFQLNQELTQHLKTLGLKSGTTLFMTLLATFSVLLARYSNQDDIVVGSPIANRNRSEIEPLIGFFANTLVLRIDLSGNPTFQDLLSRVRQVALEAYTHQDVPFEKLVQELHPERTLTHNPLFQVLFALRNFPRQDRQLPNLTLSEVDDPPETAKVDLDLFFVEETEGLNGVFVYNADLFEAATIKRMIGHFQTLVGAIVTHPNCPLTELSILTPWERQQLLVEWNNTAADYPQDQCIHQLFETQVEKTPDAVAVVFEEFSLTYRQLNVQANQLAHHLISLGVGPETLVGLCVERSLDMLVGLLGILKAGGAYVPLDPTYPQKRIAYAFSDAQTSVLLTQKHLLARLPEHDGVVICLDRDWPTIASTLTENPHSGVNSNNLAYIIYTSGSTGLPKGVLIQHQSVVNLLTTMQVSPGLSPTDRVVAAASLAFDMSILELLLPLVVGAQVLILSQDVARNGQQLKTQLRCTQTTVMQATPATWQMLRAVGWSAAATPMKVLCGGEALSYDIAHSLLGSGNSLWNLYGPSESTVWSTRYPVESLDSRTISDPRRAISIGRPIANTQIYILDTHLQPVPIGVSGELHIGGTGLARGYLNRPALTAEKFIANPLGTGHLYKTGDLARYLPDGNIEFLGRLDHQVKIRGFRIELGEIEAILAQHPAVRETVATVREDRPGDKRLIAYVIPYDLSTINNPQSTIHHQLSSFLKHQLPAYMVPAAFVLRENLPLSPNGKIDRQALQALEETWHLCDKTFVAPRNQLERELITLWEQLLAVKSIGVRDNFFDLGGHSLLVVRLVYEIDKRFGQYLHPSVLFQAPTIEELSKVLERPKVFSTSSAVVSFQPSGTKPPIFLAPGLSGDAIELAKLAQYLGSDQPVYGLQTIGLDGKQPPYSTIEDIATHLVQAIQTIHPEGPYYLAGACFGGIVAFEMAQQLRRQGYQVNFLALIDCTHWSIMPEILSPIDLVDDKSQVSLLAKRMKRLHTLANKEIRYFKRINYHFKLRYLRDTIQKIYHKLKLHQSLLQFFKFKEIHINALSQYVLQSYEGNINLLVTNHLRNKRPNQPPHLGWERVVTGQVNINIIPGVHGDFQREPFVQEVAEVLKACVERVER